jgi:GH15 family glucan-1,4-alpha-glucosidase
MMASRIADHALIGDGRSAALVARDGSVDWLCWPRFDSPSLLAAILDARRGGSFRVTPRAVRRVTRAYAGDSNVLVTTFDTAGGTVRLVDLMPVAEEDDKRRLLLPSHELLRVATCDAGEVLLDVWFEPRPDYGRRAAHLRCRGALGIRLEDGRRLLTLRSSAPLAIRDGDVASGSVLLRAGETLQLSLTYDEDGPAVLPPLGERAHDAVRRSVELWTRWAARCAYDGPHRDAVVRSLLALKLLSFAPSGAIVAAPTTSLPERVGGDLNWDYRYCWIRDASLTVRALLAVGYEEEARAFASWLLHATRLTWPEIRVLYDVHGEPPREEEILAHLDGHRGSRPVRIHNAAADQLQIDGYGELIDAVAQLVRRGMPLDRSTQAMLRQLGRWVCENGARPDEGIWEPRAGPREHTFSRVLAAVALDRLLELAALGALSGLNVERMRAARDGFRVDVEQRGWNPRLRSYTQALGGDTVDASLLLMSWYGYADVRDPRVVATYGRIEERLSAGAGLLYRYEESRDAGEGAFGICGFWAVEYLARGGGSLEQAEARFEALLANANDVGLHAEEVDPATREPLGNFPQAFTHVGLVGAALALEERRRAEGRGAPSRLAEPRAHPGVGT